jgi:hypothetical protein
MKPPSPNPDRRVEQGLIGVLPGEIYRSGPAQRLPAEQTFTGLLAELVGDPVDEAVPGFLTTLRATLESRQIGMPTD